MLYLSRYQTEDRQRDGKTEHELGKRLLAEGLKREYGGCWDADRDVYRDAFGKPFLKARSDIYFNISHTEGLAVCVIDRVPVGVDAEKIRSFRTSAMKKICSSEEIGWILEDNRIKEDRMTSGGMTEMDFRFFSVWTLKESYVKAIGLGLSFPMREICFSREQLEEVRKQPEKSGIRIPGWHFIQWRTGSWVMSVCRRQAEGPQQAEEAVLREAGLKKEWVIWEDEEQ
ncbi:MAG: 4'-phosphopantetheinyl transferase family protein [Enterocloster sp.]